MRSFLAKLKIIGVNPFVKVPPKILHDIFKKANKNKGPIPVYGTINRKAYKQTLVKFSGAWRFYVNTTMLKNSPRRIGETVVITIDFDGSDRTLKPHPELSAVLKKNKTAHAVFLQLPPYRRHEIVRYISNLKTEESIDRNIKKVIEHLTGKGKFAGRDKI